MLKEMWGRTSYSVIAKNTGHTETAVRLKAKRMGLGAMKDASYYVCAREVSRMMGVDVHKVTDYWVRKYGLKCKKIKSKKRTLWIFININELIKFLENHQDLWDSRKVEMYAFGMEPEWLKEKRKRDRSGGIR